MSNTPYHHEQRKDVDPPLVTQLTLKDCFTVQMDRRSLLQALSALTTLGILPACNEQASHIQIDLTGSSLEKLQPQLQQPGARALASSSLHTHLVELQDVLMVTPRENWLNLIASRHKDNIESGTFIELDQWWLTPTEACIYGLCLNTKTNEAK